MTFSIVSDLQHYDSQLTEVDKMLEQMYKMLGCTLTTIPGVNVITAVKILAEIGDIKRFSNANKLAQFAGIAPFHLSYSGKGKGCSYQAGKQTTADHYLFSCNPDGAAILKRHTKKSSSASLLREA